VRLRETALRLLLKRKRLREVGVVEGNLAAEELLSRARL